MSSGVCSATNARHAPSSSPASPDTVAWKSRAREGGEEGTGLRATAAGRLGRGRAEEEDVHCANHVNRTTSHRELLRKGRRRQHPREEVQEVHCFVKRPQSGVLRPRRSPNGPPGFTSRNPRRFSTLSPGRAIEQFATDRPFQE